jgi:hypothetical protein
MTRANLTQTTTAQTLLSEHQNLSSISYRMFKQLTDELLFGKNANQAVIRNKQALIEQSLSKIRVLEVQQRQALGKAITDGSVEDTDDLMALINEIIDEFNAIATEDWDKSSALQNRLQYLLEVKIDNEFREAINAAVVRQGNVVTSINARIEMLNTAILWFSIGISVFAMPLILFACYWLFNQLYQPLALINNGTKPLHQEITNSAYQRR